MAFIKPAIWKEFVLINSNLFIHFFSCLVNLSDLPKDTGQFFQAVWKEYSSLVEVTGLICPH